MFTDASQPSRSILVIGAFGVWGREVCFALAGKGARILIPHAAHHEEILHLCAEVAAQGAVVLPLEINPLSTDNDWSKLLERQVEDFGRLDAVIFVLPPVVASADSKDLWLESEAIRACARLAGPILQPIRPAGHFLIMCAAGHVGDDERQLDREKAVQDLTSVVAAEWAAKKIRACVNLLLVHGDECIAETAAYAKGLLMQRGESGEVIRFGEADRF